MNFSDQKFCNTVVTRPMIMWSSTWSSMISSIWSNTSPTNLIFLKPNKPYLHYYQICHHRLAILIASCYYYWLATFGTKHGHYYYYHHCYLYQEILKVLIKLLSLCISLYYLPTSFYIQYLSVKTNACHATGRAVSEVVRGWLTGSN